MTDTKIEPSKTWVSLAFLATVVVITGTAVMMWSGLDNRLTRSDERATASMQMLRNAIEDESSVRARERHDQDEKLAAVVIGVREVRDEIRKLTTDLIAQRQGIQWIDNFQLVVDSFLDKLRSDNPTLRVPPMKVPPLPR